jgi:hypothetical protein
MANDFKRFTKASCGTGTGASADAVYTMPSSGGTAMETVVIGIYLSNKTANGVTASVFLDALGGTSDDVYLLKDATIPAGASLEVVSGGKVVVQGNGSANDIVRVSCGTATALDAVVSVLEDV